MAGRKCSVTSSRPRLTGTSARRAASACGTLSSVADPGSASSIRSRRANASTSPGARRGSESSQSSPPQVIASAREGVVVYDADLRYVVWNSFMEEFSGVPRHKVIGRHPLEVFPTLWDAENPCLLMAKNGCAVLCYDPIGQGEARVSGS